MKKIILLAVYLVFSQFANAQEYFWAYKQGTTFDSISGKKIKSVIKITKYSWVSDKEYYYNAEFTEKGNLVYEINTIKKGKRKIISRDTIFPVVDSIITKEAGLTKKIMSFQNGKFLSGSDYEYNDKNDIIVKNITPPTSSDNINKYTYKYAENGLISEEKAYKEDYGEFFSNTYRYDSNKNCIEELNKGNNIDMWGINGEFTYIPYTYLKKYIYDAENRLVKMSTESLTSLESKPVITTYEYSETEEGKTLLVTDYPTRELYTYNKAGLLTKCEQYKYEDKKPSRTEGYTYEFY